MYMDLCNAIHNVGVTVGVKKVGHGRQGFGKLETGVVGVKSKGGR